MTKTTARKATTNETRLELAEATLRTLEQKRARLAAKREDDDKELAQISYLAHTGDKDAAERVDAIHERKMKCETEIQSVGVCSKRERPRRVSQRGAVAAPVLTKTLTAKNQ